ncbi:MAG: alkyl/aryl-sulfatase [Sphingomonadaceae bacterium]
MKELPFDDRADYEAATRGLVESFTGVISDATGRVIWNHAAFDFLKADKAPDTVNPSLWRQAQLNAQTGLFKVTDRVYQVRGIDLANMTIVEGDSGIIIIDPLTTTETASTALDLYFRNRPKKAVVAVIYTHSHLDHFGGVRGVVNEANVRSGRVKIIAPSGFLHEAVSENIMAGTAMLRRAQYQGAFPVPLSAEGQVDTGIGKSAVRGGEIGLIAPTDEVKSAYETRTIDGVTIEFQLTSGAEAPADMNFYLSQMRVFGAADNVLQAMHNVLTPRGAQVRDAKAWSRFLDQSLVRYGNRSDVMIGQHGWPTWGGDNVRMMLADQRDMYAFINDRTLHLANKGLTPAEIADAMKTLPGTLGKKWYTRSYYGSLGFNARAVYQRFLGFYDANPVNLDPLTPVEESRRYVEAMGGSDRVLEMMRGAMAEGDYRWAVQLGNRLVFAEPQNTDARAAQADAFEQLAYQSENGLWRNMYLTGAIELRQGVQKQTPRNTADMVGAMEPPMFFDLMAVRLDLDKALGHDMTLNWVFPDIDQSFAMTLRNGVLTHREGQVHSQADATIRLDKPTLDKVNLRELDLKTAIATGQIQVEGSTGKLVELMGLLSKFDPAFNVVEP